MNTHNFDYSKTMMMKLGIANPDNEGGSIIYHTFEQALEKIKAIDALTLGVTKIIYLVGWQYLGHDDRYPAFFEVNNHAKRPQDKNGRESLLWLIEQAKKYHTTVSLHINLSDAYQDSPLWQEYLDNDLILLNRSGKPKVTGVWNGRKAYHVRFWQEFESGFFQKRAERLLELLPVEEMKTVHVDAFFVHRGKDTTILKEKEARRKMIAWFNSRSIDVTSEFIYREKRSGYNSLWGKSDIVGLVPAVWNLKMTQRDFLKYPPQLLAGGRLCPGIQCDMGLEALFYGNIAGENLFSKPNWQELFLEDFACINVPYFYLNQLQRERVCGIGRRRTAFFSDGVQTHIKNKKIVKNGVVLKENETLLLPVYWLENSHFAFSKISCKREYPFENGRATIQKITAQGLGEPMTVQIKNKKLQIKFQAGSAFLVKWMPEQ